MQVKVFEAEDMATGLRKVKESMGPNAMIISTKTISKGKLGIGKSMLEITAAIDSPWEENDTPPPPRNAAGNQEYSRQSYTGMPSAGAPAEHDISYSQLWDNEQGGAEAASAPSPASQAGRPRSSASNRAELRSMIQGMSKKLNAGPDSYPDNRSLGMEPPSMPNTLPSMPRPQASSGDDPIADFLKEYGINQQTAELVARYSRDAIAETDHLDHNVLGAIFKTAIARLCTTTRVLDRPIKEQKRISLIGPTGVGKTTTIAKLAANYLGQFGGKVALITIDTYRIAAVEQLKVYGEIMRLPVEVVLHPQELEQALQTYSDYDLIFIDTAGRSPRNEKEIKEMAAFLPAHLEIENHLLLSATTRERVLEETISRFSVLPLKSFIFTKIDECDQLGAILNIHSQHETPISYLTNGQRVPEDIVAPSPATLADLLLTTSGSHNHGQ